MRRFFGDKRVLLALRLVLAAIFILAAMGKLPEPARFMMTVSGYGLLPLPLARFYGFALPWLELGVGVFLAVGLLSRFVAGLSILMVISFIVANAAIGLDIVANATVGLDRDYCSCLGDYIQLTPTTALTVDVIMLSIAATVLIYGGGLSSLDSLIDSRLRKPTP